MRLTRLDGKCREELRMTSSVLGFRRLNHLKLQSVYSYGVGEQRESGVGEDGALDVS